MGPRIHQWDQAFEGSVVNRICHFSGESREVTSSVPFRIRVHSDTRHDMRPLILFINLINVNINIQMLMFIDNIYMLTYK